MYKITQQKKLLKELKNNPSGVNSYYTAYYMRIKQAPTRIKELKEQGYQIKSVLNKDRSVNWILTDNAEQISSIEQKPQKYIFIENRAIPI